jgi:hypothetical protein
VESEAGNLVDRQRILKEIDAAGIMATPGNSSYNELVIEAARESILNGGKLVEVQQLHSESAGG